MNSLRHPPPRLSVVTPAHCEQANLPVLYRRLRATLDQTAIAWEWLIVDDASTDRTYEVAAAIAETDRRVRVIRFSRNFGSHVAIMCGLDHSRGDAAVCMATDLQDPPETIPEMLDAWNAGNQVIWAVRADREGEPRSTIAFSRFYRWLLRNVAGLKNAPRTGADFVLLDRRVIDAVCRFREQNTSFFALLTWMGFRQASVSYVKQARLEGRSGWTLRKKVKLLVDSLTSFTYLPVRVMSGIGIVISLLGFMYAFVVIANALLGAPVQGWSSIMVALLVLGGTQICMLGILGEYLWRTLAESRRRPRYVIEGAIGGTVANGRGSTGLERDFLWPAADTRQGREAFASSAGTVRSRSPVTRRDNMSERGGLAP